MIHLALICRTHDGLPMSASTDDGPGGCGFDPRELYRQLRMLSRKASNFPDRCSYLIGPAAVYFITALNVTFFALCDVSYPAVLAFSFLNEIQKEFIISYEKKQLDTVSRPYAFIEFDVFMKKTKSRYNNPRSLTTRLNLSDLGQEMKLRPPYQISPNEVEPNRFQTASYRTAARTRKKFMPLNAAGFLSVGINIFCSILHLIRGVHAVGIGHADPYEDDAIYLHTSSAFFVSFILTVFQIYLMLYPVKMRKILAGMTLTCTCLYQLYLWEFRNSITVLVFYVATTCFSTFIICTRRLEEKQEQYLL